MHWKIMIEFSVVLFCVLLCTTLLTNYYSTRFIKEQIVKYNSQIMSKVIYDLDNLYNQMTQVALKNTNQTSNKMWDNQHTGAIDFGSIKRQIDFEINVKNMISLQNMQQIIPGMILYIDDERNYYVGDSVMDSEFPISKSPWYKEFSKSKDTSIIYGPIMEDYKPKNTVKQEVLLYIRKLTIPTSIRTDKKPFILLSIKFNEIEKLFQQIFSKNRGVVISDSKGTIIYSNDLEESNIDTLIKQDHYRALKGNELPYTTYSEKGIFFTSMYAPKYDWIISTMDSEDELFKSVKDLVRTINICIALCGIVGIAVALWCSKRVMMPIQVLHHLINTIEEENDTYIDVKSKDEIGQIGHRFNHMKKRLQEMNGLIYLSEAKEKEAQLSALQAQINPHFLYNTLDNIYCIAQIEEITPIVQLAQSLSSMMRYSIDCKDMYTDLSQELNHVKAYIDIINIRYDDSILYHLNMEEGLNQARTIKLLLQPIVENAWIHGILLTKRHKGEIFVDIHKNGDDLEIVIEDDGIGIKEEQLILINQSLETVHKEIRSPQNKGFGIALVNVNDRIKLVDGDGFGIKIGIGNKGCRVMIRQKLRILEN